jgi:hypothetical protein
MRIVEDVAAGFHFFLPRAGPLFCDWRRPLLLVCLTPLVMGASFASDSIVNRSISHRPAGPGGVSTLYMAFMPYGEALNAATMGTSRESRPNLIRNKPHTRLATRDEPCSDCG